jgi:hypothetical protein
LAEPIGREFGGPKGSFDTFLMEGLGDKIKDLKMKKSVNFYLK